MLSKTLLEVSIKACADYMQANLLADKLADSGAPEVILNTIVADKLLMMALVGAHANSNALPRHVFERTLVVAECPLDNRSDMMQVYDDALASYRASVKFEGLNPDAAAKSPMPTEGEVQSILKLISGSSKMFFVMPNRNNDKFKQGAYSPEEALAKVAAKEATRELAASGKTREDLN